MVQIFYELLIVIAFNVALNEKVNELSKFKKNKKIVSTAFNIVESLQGIINSFADFWVMSFDPFHQTDFHGIKCEEKTTENH